ncbi:melanoma inhibitory activity protein 3-like, partial [Tropilaelaps mercedesae]
PEPLHSLLWDLEEKGVSSHVVVLTSLCGLASSILLMFFRYMSMSSKEGALSDHIARLEQQLFALKKEREILLESRETGHGLIGDQALPDEFIQRHERELEALEGRANHAERESRHLKEVIDQLQGALRQAQESLAESENAREDYDLKQQELAEELNELRILIEENQNKAEQKDRELEEKNKALSELQESNAQILQEAEIWDQRVRELTSRIEVDSAEVTRLQKDLMEKSTDVEALKESLKNMSVLEKAQEASGNADDENDVMKRLVDVQKAQRQNEELVSKNATLQSELTDAKEQLGSWRNEIEHLKENLKQAEKDKEESERKLAVLTEYFKDKELTLQRDVVMHETLRLKKENDVLSVSEQLELYRVENVNL